MKTIQMVDIRDKKGNLIFVIPCTTKKCAIATMRYFNKRHDTLIADYDENNISFEATLRNEKYIEHYETL